MLKRNLLVAIFGILLAVSLSVSNVYAFSASTSPSSTVNAGSGVSPTTPSGGSYDAQEQSLCAQPSNDSSTINSLLALNQFVALSFGHNYKLQAE
ncbi:MAG TPA: hypothetical protein VN739_04010 [Nitrososphaerales archaeon]|nr:hypothetical protein [Nitrososphaerales archaeon]